MTDPTRTEDVEEALEKLEAHITGYPQMPKVSAKRKLNVVRRALRDLRSALDSREDEGEHVLHKPGCSFIVNGTCNKGCADEPEGDGMTDVQKARCIAYREGFGDGYGYARETDPPTDEPVSREGEKGRSLDLEYARTNEMVDESVTMGAPSPMPLGYMVMSSIPDDCRGCTWETLSGTGRVEKWILEERDPDCPVHADEPEGDGEHSEGGRG